MPVGASRTRSEPKKAAGGSLGTCLLMTVLALVAFAATYTAVSSLHGSPLPVDEDMEEPRFTREEETVSTTPNEPQFCNGIAHMELWGDSVKWGANNLLDTPQECCAQCRAMCPVDKENCVCNSWVYCEDKELCKENHRQCWLKKQHDVLKPQIRSTSQIGWTSGIIHPHNEGIVALETNEGTLRIRLFAHWAPRTVGYLRDLVALKHCVGCQFYRGEGLGSGWDGDGKRIFERPPGPPYAILQGTFHADNVPFKPIELEATPVVKRGHVCLIEKGPDFFISLGDHPEWGTSHTVFGEILGEDLKLAEKLAIRATRKTLWDGVEVREFEDPLDFVFTRWQE